MPMKIVRKGGKLYLKGRKKKSQGGGLTKTEKKQTKKIVANALKKEHVLKYFNAQSNDNAVAPQPTDVEVTGIKTQVSVLGYSSTTEFDTAGATQYYGANEIQPLYMTRPFRESNTEDELAAQALNGQYCAPKKAQAQFSIERVFYRQPVESSDDLPPGAAHTLPISYRIIKIEFKQTTNTQNKSEPSHDLFINTFGQETGIDEPNFDRMDCIYSPVNTQKYKKLMDLKGTIVQNSIFSENSADSTSNRRVDITTGKNGKSFLHLNVPFQLSQRKNGKLFYSDPQSPGTNSMTNGGKRQLLLMHFWYDNGHNLLGGTTSGENQPECPTALDLQIKSRACSAFVDVQ